MVLEHPATGDISTLEGRVHYLCVLGYQNADVTLSLYLIKSTEFAVVCLMFVVFAVFCKMW